MPRCSCAWAGSQLISWGNTAVYNFFAVLPLMMAQARELLDCSVQLIASSLYGYGSARTRESISGGASFRQRRKEERKTNKRALGQPDVRCRATKRASPGGFWANISHVRMYATDSEESALCEAPPARNPNDAGNKRRAMAATAEAIHARSSLVHGG